MNPQQVPKNLPLIEALGQMGFRLCLLGMIGFLCSLMAQRLLGSDTSSSSMTFQLLISCWGFAAAGGVLFVCSQFVVGPFKKKRMKSKGSLKETAYQLALLGSRYRVYNGIDILTDKGTVQSYPHVVVGPNGVFYLAPVEEVVHAHEVVLSELLWSKNIRNVEITSIPLPTPRLAQTIQQQRAKRRLAQADVDRIATLIEGSSRPSKEKPVENKNSPLVWMVPVAVFALVVTWVVVGNQPPNW